MGAKFSTSEDYSELLPVRLAVRKALREFFGFSFALALVFAVYLFPQQQSHDFLAIVLISMTIGFIGGAFLWALYAWRASP